MGTELIPPARPYFPQPDIEEMKTHLEKILTSRMQTLGEYAKQFEQMFATIAQAKRAVAVNSGTSALEIALRT